MSSHRRNVQAYTPGGNRTSKLSSDSVAITTKEEQLLNEAAQKGVSELEIAVDGKEVLFQLVEIPFDRIEAETFVSEDNVRDQSIMSRLSVIDITNKISDKGQLYPGLAIKHTDSQGGVTYEVIDGSQRRSGCFYSKRGFKIYATSQNITRESKQSLSEVSNTHRPMSLYELGKQWLNLKKEQGLNNIQIATEKGYDKNLVSAGIKAAELPKWLIDVIPSVPDLGRPSIIELDKKITSLSDKEKSGFENFCSSLLEETEDLRLTALSAKHANAQIVKKILSYTYAEQDENQGQDASTRPKKLKKKLDNGSEVHVKHDSLKGEFSFTVKNISDAQKQQLDQLLGDWGLSI
ncbi:MULTISPECIES: ParB N-terminal domain-containing protein [Vibrio harveyi group]|uniref:ParB N-terminal domain-containing protein n=1 Tax=Vibrio harveyi group TaxID=717610 RepID=UPI0006CA6422|nr:ParB N-terminal domain-containing protein [Vibrio alginolyticus]KPM92280.1 hypothetical protein AOR10_13870 [Vibrio alginolyticus]